MSQGPPEHRAYTRWKDRAGQGLEEGMDRGESGQNSTESGSERKALPAFTGLLADCHRATNI